MAFGVSPKSTAAVVKAVRRETSLPIVCKLTPNVTDIAEIALAAEAAGADAISLINTLLGMAIDVETRRPVLANVQGGLSGPAIRPIAVLKTWQAYQVAHKHNVPIIGQGGIISARDALEFIIAGATTVGVGTALFYDPLVCRNINAGIAEYLARHKIARLADLVGSLATGASAPAEACG